MNKEHSVVSLLRSVGVYAATSHDKVGSWCMDNPSTRLALQLYKIDLEMLVKNPRKCVPFYYRTIKSDNHKKQIWRTPEYDTQYAPGCCPNCKKDVLHCVCTDPFSYFTYDRPHMPRSKALKAHWEDPIHSVNPHPRVGPIYSGAETRGTFDPTAMDREIVIKLKEVQSMMKDALDNRPEGALTTDFLATSFNVEADLPHPEDELTSGAIRSALQQQEKHDEQSTLLSQCLVRTTPTARHEVVMGRKYEYDGHVVVARDSYRDKYKELSFILVDDEQAKRLTHVRMEELYEIYPDCVYRLIRLAIQDNSELSRFLMFVATREPVLLSKFIARETGENDVAKYTSYVIRALLLIDDKRKEKADAAAANK